MFGFSLPEMDSFVFVRCSTCSLMGYSYRLARVWSRDIYRDENVEECLYDDYGI